MPVAPTYPGVYIEEVPSGVRTLTGVSTSITAFVGYTPRGPVDVPVHIFSFADYQRAFDGLAVDSPLSYAVRFFFQNGGGEAYVVRVAQNAKAASVRLKNSTANTGVNVLDVTAASAGIWGNNLRIDVDYDTASPASLFNLTVTELVDQGGELVPGRTEVFRNLSMNSFDPGDVVSAVNASSELVTVARSGVLAPTAKGLGRSGVLTAADLTKLKAGEADRLAFMLDGQGPFELTLTLPIANLAALTTEIEKRMELVSGKTVTVTEAAGVVTVTSDDTSERSAVRFLDASRNNAAAALKLGLSRGGTEIEAQAGLRPLRTGTITPVPPDLAGLGANGNLQVQVFNGSAAAALATVLVALWGGATGLAKPTTIAEAADRLREALTASGDPLLAGTSVAVSGGGLRVVPSGMANPSHSFEFADVGGGDTSATRLGLVGGTVVRNVARYAPGAGATALAQDAGVVGNNGAPPTKVELAGKELAKTGLYALERVDLFNLLVMPDRAADVSVQTEAIAYCERRRAMMIIDAPDDLTSHAKAEAWIAGSNASALRSRNAALYFPRLRAPDPLMNGAVGTFPAAGALAGLYARTDAQAGVWKAPAGTDAAIVGATGLSVVLTDKENGTLNPKALNCLRLFPVIGTVSWGARTARGADVLADDYKYLPVRRLALFLEESLYRGTQWAVFQPNDEPLWAQIRLNLGAFMHTLYGQGAFQGRSPRDAYFVKCDKETTTQNDINLGRVNIVVGFAPLKPAEFVVIQIRQIAGAIQT